VRRWVVYPGPADLSSVPAELHAWLHYTTDAPLPNALRYAWPKPHLSNAMGTAAAYRPPSHDYSGSHRPAADGDYESWLQADTIRPTKAEVARSGSSPVEAVGAQHSGAQVRRPPSIEAGRKWNSGTINRKV
jgi:hypothetical protein